MPLARSTKTVHLGFMRAQMLVLNLLGALVTFASCALSSGTHSDRTALAQPDAAVMPSTVPDAHAQGTGGTGDAGKPTTRLRQFAAEGLPVPYYLDTLRDERCTFERTSSGMLCLPQIQASVIEQQACPGVRVFVSNCPGAHYGSTYDSCGNVTVYDLKPVRAGCSLPYSSVFYFEGEPVDLAAFVRVSE